MELPLVKKLDLIPVKDHNSRRAEILKQGIKSVSVSRFDPHHPDQLMIRHGALKNLRCGLPALNQPCAFLDVLVPSTEKSHMTTSMPSHQGMM